MNTDDHSETKLLPEPILAVDISGIKPVVKTGYQWLEEMTTVRNQRGYSRHNFSPLTNRAMFIINALNSLGVQSEIDIFDDAGYDLFNYDRPKLVNIIVRFGSRSGQPAIVFSAHHDIANPDSDNCQDNSASVCNLIHLCAVLKGQAIGESANIIAQRPVIIVFTDKEESGGVGARRMSGRLLRGDFGDFEYNINLELTGLGKSLWVDTENFRYKSKPASVKKFDDTVGESGYHKVSTPFSDAIIFRRCRIDSVCIGILPEQELTGGTRPPTWNICHKEEDTIDKCNAEDMSEFVNILERLILN